MRRKSFLGIGLLAFAIVAGLGLEVAAWAQVVTVGPVQGSTKAQVVQALKSAHKLLAAANRDYNGHRAQAAQHVQGALKALGYHPKKARPAASPNLAIAAAPRPAVSGKPAVHEVQSTSDAQLRQAQQILAGALTTMSAGHPKAAAKINAAIAEINVALSIR
jgi:hypothetical protein